MTEPTPAVDYVNLYILTPEEVLYEGQVLWVEVPLEDGLLGVWPGHAPLVAALGEGVVRYDTGEGVREMAVRRGVLRIGIERCAILLSAWGQQALPEQQGDKEELAADLEKALFETLSEQEIEELQKE